MIKTPQKTSNNLGHYRSISKEASSQTASLDSNRDMTSPYRSCDLSNTSRKTSTFSSTPRPHFSTLTKRSTRCGMTDYCSKWRQPVFQTGMLRLTQPSLHQRTFRVKMKDRVSTNRSTSLPTTSQTTLAIYADDVLIYTRSPNAEMAEKKLQRAPKDLDRQYTICRIAIHKKKARPCFFREVENENEDMDHRRS